MQFTIEAERLRSAVGLCRSVVDRVQTMPILANILVEADEEGVTFVSTDLNVELKVKAEAAVAKPGETTVQAITFAELVRHLPDGSNVDLALDEDGGRLSVVAERSEFHLGTLPAKDFPRMANEDFDVSFSAPSGPLRTLFGRSRIAISKDESRRYLNGAYFHFWTEDESRKLRCVSTDGFILSLAETDAPDDSDQMEGVIVPEKTVQEIARILDGENEPVTVSVSEGKISFQTGRLSFLSRVIDARFPDYARLIPKESAYRLTSDAAALRNAVLRVSSVSVQQIRAVNMKMEPDKLELSVTSPESGSGTEVIQAQFPHATTTIKFGHRHLLTILSEMESGDVSFGFDSPQSATIIREESNPEALYVVMPLKV